MKQETTLQKQNQSKRLTDSGFIMKCKDILYPVMMLLTGTVVHYRVEKANDYAALPDKPIIFVANHGAFPDLPVMLRTTKRRSYALLGTQNLAFIDWVFFLVNGVIWVNRKNKADMAASKDALIAYLQKGRSVLWFPEGTWNLEPSRLMLPMKWGVIDVARQADAQIIPTALDYDREKMVCSVKFGTPMSGADFDNKAEAIRNLRDTMATMRWDFWERNGTFSRADLDMDAEQKKLFYSVEEYPPIDWEYESSCVYNPHSQVEIVPANLIPSCENAFLFGKN